MELGPLRLDHLPGLVALVQSMDQYELRRPLNRFPSTLRPLLPVKCREGPQGLDCRHERTMMNGFSVPPLLRLTVPPAILQLVLDQPVKHLMKDRKSTRLNSS